jgi:hypothetical protein
MKPTFKIWPSAEQCGYLNFSIKGLNIYIIESICEEQITFEYINNLSLWKQDY